MVLLLVPELTCHMESLHINKAGKKGRNGNISL